MDEICDARPRAKGCFRRSISFPSVLSSPRSSHVEKYKVFSRHVARDHQASCDSKCALPTTSLFPPSKHGRARRVKKEDRYVCAWYRSSYVCFRNATPCFVLVPTCDGARLPFFRNEVERELRNVPRFQAQRRMRRKGRERELLRAMRNISLRFSFDTRTQEQTK